MMPKNTVRVWGHFFDGLCTFVFGNYYGVVLHILYTYVWYTVGMNGISCV